MKRKERRLLAFKWAKQDIKKLGAPRSKLYQFVDMYMAKLRMNPNYRRIE